MSPEQLAELKENEITRQRLAKFMAQYCFRNIHELEELHGAGRITQEEMKALMIDVVDHCYNFVTELFRRRERSSSKTWKYATRFRNGMIQSQWRSHSCDFLSLVSHELGRSGQVPSEAINLWACISADRRCLAAYAGRAAVRLTR